MRRVWAVGLIAGMASYLDAAALITVAISLSIWQQHFGLGPWQTGALSFGLNLSFAVGALVGGWLGDRFGRVRMLGLDIAGFVVGACGLLVAPTTETLIAAAVLIGLAAGADLPVSLAVIADLVPADRRGRFTGMTQVLWIAGVLGTFLLGFAVAELGYAGTRVLVAHLIVLGAITWLLRRQLRGAVGTPHEQPGGSRPAARPLVAAARRAPALPTLTAFLLCWNVASTTLGSFGPYFLVRVTRLSQSEATGLVLLTFPLSLVVAVAFARLADTFWRDRLFVVAMLCQIAAFAVGAVTGGTALAGMVALIVLYSVSNTFAGEAVFKVWSQLLHPDDVRATAIGFSFAVARTVAATFLLLVPTIIATAPVALLVILSACVTVSGVIGLAVTRRIRRAPAAAPSA